MFGKPLGGIISWQRQRRFTLAANAVEQAHVVDRLDVTLEPWEAVQGHEIIPDRDVTDPMRVIIAKLGLQNVGLQLVEKGTRGFL